MIQSPSSRIGEPSGLSTAKALLKKFSISIPLEAPYCSNQLLVLSEAGLAFSSRSRRSAVLRGQARRYMNYRIHNFLK